MSEVQAYLDCGCAVLKNGKITLCPTCSSPKPHLYTEAEVEAERERILAQAYLAARGTDKLQKRGNRQLYWKGRMDAAADVRALKRLKAK